VVITPYLKSRERQASENTKRNRASKGHLQTVEQREKQVRTLKEIE
jgi:hypothetical protein